MANYSINNNNAASPAQQNLTSTYKTLVGVASTSGSLRRGKLYDFMFGTNGTPADNYMEFDVSQQTAAGTGTASTPQPLDPADVAALTTGIINCTAEPTVTASSSRFYLGINQRASYRWVAAPGSEIVWPSTAANGLVGRARSGGYTGTATSEFLFQEQ